MPKKKTEKRKKEGKYSVEFSLLSLFFWGLGSFFLLVWIFVLGILVGRGFLPEGVKTLSELKTPIAKLQEMVTHKESDDDLAHLKKMNKEPKFEFYDELSAKKEKALKKGQVETKKKSPAITPSPDTSIFQEEKLSSRNVNIKDGSNVSSPQERDGEYTLQLASLESELQALKMTERLKEEGYPAYYYVVEIKGKRYFRVRCGRFKEKNEAIDLKNILVEKKDINGFVTRADE